MKVHVETAQIGEYRRTHLLALIESMRASILDSGRIGDAELRQHMRALSEHLANSATVLIDKMIVQVWRQKPKLEGQCA